MKQASEEAQEGDRRTSSRRTGRSGRSRGLAARRSTTRARRMADLAENMEALKRNFLFRGFFTPARLLRSRRTSRRAEYRQGVLEAKGPRARCAIWLARRALRRATADGCRDALPTEGRRGSIRRWRTFLDPAPDKQSSWSRATRHGEIQRRGRSLLSRTRASMVARLLIGKFRSTRRTIGLMPLGPEAPGSPANNTWDGVALAPFVERPQPHGEWQVGRRLSRFRWHVPLDTSKCVGMSTHSS